jgi:hypothetical protein
MGFGVSNRSEETTMTAAFRRTVYGLGLIGVLAVTGCGGDDPPPPDPMLGGRVGDNCTVYLRRDALGMAAPSPSPALTGNHNGADTAVSGKLIRVNAEWVVIADGRRELTIPKSAILVIEVPTK